MFLRRTVGLSPLGLDDCPDTARIQQYVNQPASTVESAPQPVAGPPRALVKGREVVQLNAGELVSCGSSRQVEQRPGVSAGLDELEPLLGLGPDRRCAPLRGVQFGQPQREPVTPRTGADTFPPG
jgi:hypothetical protein